MAPSKIQYYQLKDISSSIWDDITIWFLAICPKPTLNQVKRTILVVFFLRTQFIYYTPWHTMPPLDPCIRCYMLCYFLYIIYYFIYIYYYNATPHPSYTIGEAVQFKILPQHLDICQYIMFQKPSFSTPTCDQNTLSRMKRRKDFQFYKIAQNKYLAI